MKETRGYEYTTDILVIGCGFSGMWAAMRAKDFLDDVLVVDKGPRDWGGLGGLSGGDMIVKQPDMNLDDLLDDLVYYYDGLADQRILGQILTQSYERFMDFENWGHQFVRNRRARSVLHSPARLDHMRYYYLSSLRHGRHGTGPSAQAGMRKARRAPPRPHRDHRRHHRRRPRHRRGGLSCAERRSGLHQGSRRAARHQHRRLEAFLPSEHAGERRREHRLERGLRHAQLWNSGRCGTCPWISPGKVRPACCPRAHAFSTTRAKTSCASIRRSSAPRPIRTTTPAAWCAKCARATAPSCSTAAR